MTFIVSSLFVLAFALSAVVIIGTLRASSPQIASAIAGRHGQLKDARIVHVGPVRQTNMTTAKPAIILPFKPRFVATASTFAPSATTSTKTPATTPATQICLRDALSIAA